jgi:hypothetical protein
MAPQIVFNSMSNAVRNQVFSFTSPLAPSHCYLFPPTTLAASAAYPVSMPTQNPSLSPFTKGRRLVVQKVLSPFSKGGLRGISLQNPSRSPFREGRGYAQERGVRSKRGASSDISTGSLRGLESPFLTPKKGRLRGAKAPLLIKFPLSCGTPGQERGIKGVRLSKIKKHLNLWIAEGSRFTPTNRRPT